MVDLCLYNLFKQRYISLHVAVTLTAHCSECFVCYSGRGCHFALLLNSETKFMFTNELTCSH